MKKIRTLNDPMFKTLEKDKMKKITGGESQPSSQEHTLTIFKGGSSDDGCDTLTANEYQENPCA